MTIHTPPIPYRPMTTDQHRSRYPLAVARIFDTSEVAEGRSQRPGQCPECVFDLSDGMRLIISREHDPILELTQIHFSASARLGSHLARSIAEGKLHIEAFCRLVRSRFQQISGDLREPALVGITSGGIFHWYLTEAIDDGEA